MSKETETLDIRDGSWIDKFGACRVCGGEIPDGHTNNCDLYKMECQIKDLERQRDEANERIKTLQGMYESLDQHCMKESEKLTTSNARLQAAMAYGSHKKECPMNIIAYGITLHFEPKCTCGWNAFREVLFTKKGVV